MLDGAVDVTNPQGQITAQAKRAALVPVFEITGYADAGDLSGMGQDLGGIERVDLAGRVSRGLLWRGAADFQANVGAIADFVSSQPLPRGVHLDPATPTPPAPTPRMRRPPET